MRPRRGFEHFRQPVTVYSMGGQAGPDRRRTHVILVVGGTAAAVYWWNSRQEIPCARFLVLLVLFTAFAALVCWVVQSCYLDNRMLFCKIHIMHKSAVRPAPLHTHRLSMKNQHLVSSILF